MLTVRGSDLCAFTDQSGVPVGHHIECLQALPQIKPATIEEALFFTSNLGPDDLERRSRWLRLQQEKTLVRSFAGKLAPEICSSIARYCYPSYGLVNLKLKRHLQQHLDSLGTAMYTVTTAEPIWSLSVVHEGIRYVALLANPPLPDLGLSGFEKPECIFDPANTAADTVYVARNYLGITDVTFRHPKTNLPGRWWTIHRLSKDDKFHLKPDVS